MFKRLRRGFFVGVALLFMLCLGFATPALAEGEPTYNPSDAKLTAVIVAPVGTDASGDEYVFHFDGDGTVTAGPQEDTGKIPVYSDGIEQDNATIKDKDVVPAIPDVTLEGTTLTENNSLTDGTLHQTVVQMSIWDILKTSGILVKTNEQGSDDPTNYHVEKFPHAGIYTYEVTQKSATSDSGTAYIAASEAKYCLRIWVKNAKIEGNSELGDTSLAIDYVTVQRLLKDDGTEKVEEINGENKSVYEKVNPTNPTTNAQGKITGISDASKLAGDESGHNVPGFTFANEYFTIGPFQVKKLYDGDHSDRTRYSTVELAVKASVNPNASGGALTYTIKGEGRDLTENSEAYNQQVKKVSFGTNGWCYIKADLKEGSSIRITGELDSNGNALSSNGLFRGQTYYVLENDPYDYRPTGYVYMGANPDEVDPRKNYKENNPLWYKQDNVNNDPYDNVALPDGTSKNLSMYALFITSSKDGNQVTATGRNTTGNDTIFVVNNLDENKVSATGIFVDNLPYILMIGVPLVVFAGMFVARRRGNAA